MTSAPHIVSLLDYYEYYFELNILKSDDIHEGASLSLELWEEFIQMEDQKHLLRQVFCHLAVVAVRASGWERTMQTSCC